MESDVNAKKESLSHRWEVAAMDKADGEANKVATAVAREATAVVTVASKVVTEDTKVVVNGAETKVVVTAAAGATKEVLIRAVTAVVTVVATEVVTATGMATTILDPNAVVEEVAEAVVVAAVEVLNSPLTDRSFSSSLELLEILPPVSFSV